MVADVEMDKVADMFADIVAEKGRYSITQFGKKKKGTQFGERVGHGGWLIRPKLFRPEAYPACASSKLCEFIGMISTEIKCVCQPGCGTTQCKCKYLLWPPLDCK